jgi:hypothetical protein
MMGSSANPITGAPTTMIPKHVTASEPKADFKEPKSFNSSDPLQSVKNTLLQYKGKHFLMTFFLTSIAAESGSSMKPNTEISPWIASVLANSNQSKPLSERQLMPPPTFSPKAKSAMNAKAASPRSYKHAPDMVLESLRQFSNSIQGNSNFFK